MSHLDKLRRSRRILFVHQFLAMGDAIFLSPVYKTIKDNIEGVDISVVTHQYSIPFVEAIPYVDHVYSLESIYGQKSSRLDRFLRLSLFFIRNRFDTVILRNDRRLRQRTFNWASRICLLTTVSMRPHLEKEVTEGRHIVEAYFRILERMGFKVKEKGNLYLNLPDSAPKEAKAFLGGKTERLAGTAPVSNVKVKNMTPQKTAELINRLKEMSYNVVLFSADKEFSKSVRNLTGNNLVTVVERIDFSLLMGIIATCDIFVGVDTGPTHLAAALGIPTIGLYGPTSGIVTGPYGGRVISVQSEVDCPYYRPTSPFSPKERLQECYIEDRCKLSMINCVEKIDTQRVMDAVYRLMAKRAERDE